VKLLKIKSAARGEYSDSISLTKSLTEVGKPNNTSTPEAGTTITFDKCIGLDLRNELQRCAHTRLIEAERMSAIGMMACSISHDMRLSLANNMSGVYSK
jgi:C4-dicarboxylate-specific signal transduction histidine kinase